MDARSLHEHFEAMATRTPDAVALSSADGEISYRELDERAERWRHHLAALGAGPETPVAVLMERSPELVVATLGILKTGAYYVPLHTAYPTERLQTIVDLLGAPLLVVDDAMLERGAPSGCRNVRPGDLADSKPAEVTGGVLTSPSQLAYVMFTSGSTGEPKGVAVTHRDALGLALDRQWSGATYARALMISPYAFGMSTFELWMPLLNGGCIVLYPPGDVEIATLREVIVKQDVSVVHLTAGLFRVVAEEAPECLLPLKEVMTGGDVIPPAAVARVLEACPDLIVRAMYGATETTLFTTHSQFSAPYSPGSTVPVGKAMDNMRTYILDEQLRPAAEGELYVGGVGVARGYLGRPGLTAERFVPDHFVGGGERMYRTGDLARWSQDGQLELLGRADDQVKIRGFRVEPAEVESVLSGHPDVAHAAVISRDFEAGDKRLIAYLVPKSAELDVTAVHGYAAARLPDFMVPAAFAILEALPLTANGKLDRKALPAPPENRSASTDEVRTPVQATLCAIFAEVLEKADVGVDEDFFDLSGQSMQAIRMIMRIEQELGVRFPIPQFYDNSTPAMLAVLVEEQTQPDTTTIA